MANPVDIRDTIATELYNRFVIAQPNVDLFFENQPMDRQDNEIFVIAEIMPGDNRRADLNSSGGLVRSTGVVNCRVMVPQETGTRAARLVMDSLYEILIDRQWSLSGGGHVTLYNAEMNGRGEVNGYYAYSVSSEYRAYITLNR